jgi:hypothetical protein
MAVAVLGVVIVVACIGIPQFGRIRHRRPCDGTQAYLREAGRSARDIAQGNAAERKRQRHDVPTLASG